MTDDDDKLANLHQAHRQFLALIKDVRPELHRYCARMTGSVVDGEDIVQETLARAYYELSQLRELPALRTWLFRIAHRRTIDHLRSRHRDPVAASPEDADEVAAPEPDAAAALEDVEAVRMAVSRFVALVPAQRACVILKDVLGYSLDESAAMLELSVPAVKAALHRGRARLRSLASGAEAPAPPRRAVSPTVSRYAALFNAHDWDGVRALLVDDVKLDLVSRERRDGKAAVEKYVENYSRKNDWHMTPGWLEGREVVLVRRDRADARPSYVIELVLRGDGVAAIRDFRYVPYILAEVEADSFT